LLFILVMPELPEVETIAAGLRSIILNKIITRIIRCAPHLKKINPRGFEKKLTGLKITAIDRIGKNIFIHLSDQSFLHVHLRMTGQFLWQKKLPDCDQHDHLIFEFKKSTKLLIFRDVRKFGLIKYVTQNKTNAYWQNFKLGCDALLISPENFVELLKSKKCMIKPLLLDQSLIAGLGNIYVDEILHRVKIHPQRIADTISTKKLIQMHAVMIKILNISIANMGTTFDSFSQINSEPGQFQSYLWAYDRDGELKRIVVAQRGTNICPRCQKAPH